MRVARRKAKWTTEGSRPAAKPDLVLALRVCWLLSVRPGLGDARGLGEEYQAQLRWFYLLLPGDSLIRQFPFGKLLQRVH